MATEAEVILPKKESTVPTANAVIDQLTIGNEYTVNVTGFTYIKDYAMIKGTIGKHPVGVIIGEKQNFGIREMMELKHAGGIKATYRKDKVVNDKTYKQFQLEEIMF